MLKKLAVVALYATMSLSLASCVGTGTAQEDAAKQVDRICAAEPPLYATALVLAETKNWSEKRRNRLTAIHVTITNFCTDRPTDLISGLLTLSASYVQFLALKEQVE